MTNDDMIPEIAALAAELRLPERDDDAAWSTVRARVAARALDSGLADVAVELHDSPLGRIVLGATDAGLVRVGLPVEDEDAVLGDARRQLDEYFTGRRRTFDVVLDWCLTAGFRRDVLRATAAIPFGRTATYREIAARAGSPAAFRATGSALATNPLPIVVPCHRVLPSGGGVGQYRGGADAKQHLLSLEGAPVPR